ncbi:MAG: DUF3298 domain-containing protein [Bacteroidota bacterium]
MQNKNIVRTAMLVAIVALAYYTYSYIVASSSSSLTFAADSVVYKHGCLQPDSSCFRVVYHFPVPIGRGSSRIEKIIVTDLTDFMDEDINRKDFDHLKDMLVKSSMGFDSSYVEFVKQFGRNLEWYIDMDFTQILRTNRLVTFRYEHSSYLGGAHDLYGYHYLNIDLKNSKKLGLNDLFSDMDRFKAIAQETFTEKFLKNPADATEYWMADDGSFVLPKEFGLTDKGLLLHYNVYEIASFARGDIELLIPYSHLNDILVDKYLDELSGL